MVVRRIVIDTNVILSGLLGEGPPGKIIDAWLLGTIMPVISRELKYEINEVIRRPNIKKLMHLKSIKNIQPILGTLFNKAITITPRRVDEIIFFDKDDHFLYELAITAEATTIVTGDKKLTLVKRIKTIEILSPEKFCKKFNLK